MSFRDIFRFSNLDEKIVRVLIFSFPIFFLTLRRWSNTIAFLLALLAFFHIVSNFRHFFKDREKFFWVLFACLLMPILGEVFAQIFRGELQPTSLDGPSRFFVAAILFVFLSRRDDDLSEYLFFGAIFSVLVTFISVYFFRQYYWEAPDGSFRAATYFVDPITLPVYLLACFSLVVSRVNFSFSGRQSILYSVAALILIACVSSVLVLSQSRTPWVALIALGELLILLKSKDKKTIFVSNLFLLFFVTLMLLFFDGTMRQFLLAYVELRDYMQGGVQDTSIGLRLSLLRMDYELFVGFFPFGISDGQLPPIQWFNDRGMLVSEALYRQKLLTGSHAEISAQLVRKGIFGIPVVICLFALPIWFFRRSLKSKDLSVVKAGRMGLAFCVVIFFAGLFIQTFNLRMTSTFYSLVLAVVFADCLGKNGRWDRSLRSG
jgi:O-antigen ligase